MIKKAHEIYSKMEKTKPKSAYIAFSGETELAWLKILKTGYRHCFVILEFEESWCCIDPLSTYCDIQILSKKHMTDLPLWLRFQGHEVCRTTIATDNIKIRPFGYLSCVSLVKRILGIQKWWIVTPWQLRNYIHSHYKKEN